MRERGTLRIGLCVAALAVGVVAAGCLGAPPGPSAANLSVMPSPATFANSSQAQGFNMPQVVVTVKNTGGDIAQGVVVHPINVYSIPNSNCLTLAPGQSCTATVQFCPGAQGQYNFNLSVTGQDASTGASISGTTLLEGNAVA
jgi:hypothetical protein